MNHLETSPSPARSPTASVTGREPLALRVLRSAAIIGLSLALGLLFMLALASVPQMRSVVDALVVGTEKNRVANNTVIASFWLLPIALMVVALRLRLRSWWWIGGGWLAVLPVLAYLAADEPSRRTITLEEMAPAFPGAEKSYAVLMRYGKRHPVPEALALEKLPLKLVGLPIGPDKPDEFARFLTERRADIEADWAALEPQRRWLDELNAFDRIGDLGAASLDTDIIRFYVWRLLAQKSTTKTCLLALDGRGDDAIATLLPILEASRKLEPSARTLVRFMVARVVQHMLIEAAAVTLKQTPVSPAMRARLATALKLGAGGEAGARRLVAVDYAGVAGWLSERSLGDVLDWNRKGGPGRQALNLIGPFLYNPQRTINIYGDLVGELQEIAARRESGKISLRENEFWVTEGRPRFKNFCGPLVSARTAPALAKVVDSYWKIEDKRTALLAQLAAP